MGKQIIKFYENEGKFEGQNNLKLIKRVQVNSLSKETIGTISLLRITKKAIIEE